MMHNPIKHAAALVLVPVLVLVASLGCQPGTTSDDVTTSARLAGAAQAALDRVVLEHDAVRGAALCIDAPSLGLHWEGAAGMADPESGAPMTPEHPVRIASNTKTFIAASILRLWEEARLGLDDPIRDHLSAEHVELLRGGGYDPEQIEIRHLLTHTSGLYDHTSTPYFNEMIVSEPLHRWTRTEQLRLCMEQGEPWGGPGEVYHYTDTGYILLGGILERITGSSMPEAVRSLIGFERLGMGSTWFETLEPEPEGVKEAAHQYLGDIDAAEYDPSFDLFGGGGLASTVGDLARFTTALFSGEVFAGDATLETMLAPVEGVAAARDADESHLRPGAYRMGIWEDELEGLVVYRHSGFWGTQATRVPELGVTITVTVNQNLAKAAMMDLERSALLALRASSGDTARD
jgi:D-alanyl-D-alanine carboxypeptidase